jgi:hypothetical protein
MGHHPSQSDGTEVNLNFEGTNLERFRVKTETLKLVDRVSRASELEVVSPSKLDVGEVLERIGTVQRDNLQRLDDDIAILTVYLKAKGAPKASIDLMNSLTKQQRANWQTTIDRLQGLLAG